MRLPRNIAPKLTRLAKRLIASGLNAEPVTLLWRSTTRPPGYVHDLETSAVGSVIREHEEVISAFVHYVNIQTTGFVAHAEVRMGDAILDFPGDVELDGRDDLRFSIGGKIYVSKIGSASLASSWDVRVNGVPITKTVLVTLLS